MKCNSCNQLHSGENKSSPSLCRNLFGNQLVRIEWTFVINSLRKKLFEGGFNVFFPTHLLGRAERDCMIDPQFMSNAH